MGLFDYVRCEMPLPDCPEWATEFQSKDTPRQYMDLYLIGADGTLSHEEYDVEDRSDPDAEGVLRLLGCMTRVNRRWVPVADFDGAVEFYTSNWLGSGPGGTLVDAGKCSHYVSVCYRVVFVDGRVVKGPVLVEKEERFGRVFTDSVAWDRACKDALAERPAAGGAL